MITDRGFWKGRDVQFAKDLTATIRANAALAIRAVNELLEDFYNARPNAAGRDATSGWRPLAVNSTTAGASATSLHMRALAIDVEDDDEELDTWLMTEPGQRALVAHGLWMEHPGATPRWCHLQLKSPGSGRRVFYPR